MALDLTAIRTALAETIKAGINRDINLYPYQPTAPMLPCIIVQPGVEYVAYHTSFGPGAVTSVNFSLLLLAPTGPTTDGQRILDDLMSAGTAQGASVVDAIEADKTLGGVVHNTIVESGESLGRIPLDESNTLADARTLAVGIVLARS